MRSEDKKAAIAAYKEREIDAGVYVVRCAATGRAWVGSTPNLDKVENRILFLLRLGQHRCASLQSAWTEREGEGVSVERLEQIDGEDPPYVRRSRLKERAAHWREKLSAEPLP